MHLWQVVLLVIGLNWVAVVLAVLPDVRRVRVDDQKSAAGKSQAND